MRHCAAVTFAYRPLILLALLLPTVSALRADAVNLGFISFDAFIPGSPGSPGVNLFSINNFTGDASLGGFNLPPDFPVLDFVTFKNAKLTIEESGSNEVFPLGDLAPGTVISDLITASADLSSAMFSATFDETVLTLADGSTFTVGSHAIQALVSPSSPPFLQPGDFALITVSTVPEPGSWSLLVVGAFPLIFHRKKTRL